jgi:hypothetical protein
VNDEAAALVQLGNERATAADSIVTRSAALVSRALEVLNLAIASGQFDDTTETATKLVLASGALSSGVDGPDMLERQVHLKEQAARLRLLAELERLGMTEQQWNIAWHLAPSGPAPRGRPKKK